ncbi:MAG: hypothetical protein ABR548_02875 [Actinomycetota bacterium]|nr:hypothetical protein [Actinomycetota bacterium]
MIRWREERKRSFRLIAGGLVALLVGGFVRVGVGFLLAAALANTLAAITIVVVLAIIVFRISVGENVSDDGFAEDGEE